MVELADTRDLKSLGLNRTGSSPVSGTRIVADMNIGGKTFIGICAYIVSTPHGNCSYG